jgi:hypothetical protein
MRGQIARTMNQFLNLITQMPEAITLQWHQQLLGREV